MRRLLSLLLLLPGAALAQSPAPPPPPGPPPAVAGTQAAAEDAFVRAVEDARAAYDTGINDLVRGVARPRRAEAVCRAVPRGRVENWTGKLSTLASSPGGKGVVAIDVGPKVTLATNRTDAADTADRTLIDTRSPLFAYAAALAVGDRVQFSGTLVAGGDDCFKEVGKDLQASMDTPEYVIRLDSIRKVVPPPANAVLSGQAAPMSIAQSSDFVRDAVDTVAGAVACGAEQRRVFATIIKLLIRATAGQSVEQRDALINLMFSPPSTASQAKDDCPSKMSAFDRLEAEAS